MHGHFLNLTLSYREVSGDTRYDALLQKIATALYQKYLETDQGVLPSYRTMWWLSDNFPALAALSHYDRIFHRNTAQAKDKFLSNAKAYYLDSTTGMFCTYIDPSIHRQLQGPRGISQMYPVLFGLGLSASGFAIAAAAINGDEKTAWQLLNATAAVGGPVFRGVELHYSMMPPVGQAVILFGKTCLLKAVQPAARRLGQRGSTVNP